MPIQFTNGAILFRDGALAIDTVEIAIDGTELSIDGSAGIAFHSRCCCDDGGNAETCDTWTSDTFDGPAGIDWVQTQADLTPGPSGGQRMVTLYDGDRFTVDDDVLNHAGTAASRSGFVTGLTDATITADILFDDTLGADLQFGLFGRGGNPGSSTYLRLYYDHTTNTFSLDKVETGTPTTLASMSLTLVKSTTYTMTLSYAADAIAGTIDANSLSATNEFNIGVGTEMGILMERANVGQSVTVDDLRIQGDCCDLPSLTTATWDAEVSGLQSPDTEGNRSDYVLSLNFANSWTGEYVGVKEFEIVLQETYGVWRVQLRINEVLFGSGWKACTDGPLSPTGTYTVYGSSYNATIIVTES